MYHSKHDLTNISYSRQKCPSRTLWSRYLHRVAGRRGPPAGPVPVPGRQPHLGRCHRHGAAGQPGARLPLGRVGYAALRPARHAPGRRAAVANGRFRHCEIILFCIT